MSGSVRKPRAQMKALMAPNDAATLQPPHQELSNESS